MASSKKSMGSRRGCRGTRHAGHPSGPSSHGSNAPGRRRTPWRARMMDNPAWSPSSPDVGARRASCRRCSFLVRPPPSLVRSRVEPGRSSLTSAASWPAGFTPIRPRWSLSRRSPQKSRRRFADLRRPICCPTPRARCLPQAFLDGVGQTWMRRLPRRRIFWIDGSWRCRPSRARTAEWPLHFASHRRQRSSHTRFRPSSIRRG